MPTRVQKSDIITANSQVSAIGQAARLLSFEYRAPDTTSERTVDFSDGDGGDVRMRRRSVSITSTAWGRTFSETFPVPIEFYNDIYVEFGGGVSDIELHVVWDEQTGLGPEDCPTVYSLQSQ